MKRKSFILLVTCLIAVVVTLCACNATESALKKVDKSIASASALNSTITIVDDGVTVYSLERTVTVDGDSATVTVDEGTLGDNFVLEHTVTTQTSTKKEQLVLPLALNKDNVQTFVSQNNSFTITITKEAFATMMNSASMLSNGDVTVVFTLADNKFQQMTCTYLTEKMQNVSIVVTCAY